MVSALSTSRLLGTPRRGVNRCRRRAGCDGGRDDIAGRHDPEHQPGHPRHRVWYVNMVDPRTLLVTGLTRDGNFLVENGRIADRCAICVSTKA